MFAAPCFPSVAAAPHHIIDNQPRLSQDTAAKIHHVLVALFYLCGHVEGEDEGEGEEEGVGEDEHGELFHVKPLPLLKLTGGATPDTAALQLEAEGGRPLLPPERAVVVPPRSARAHCTLHHTATLL